jgi:hypothetical protein
MPAPNLPSLLSRIELDEQPLDRNIASVERKISRLAQNMEQTFKRMEQIGKRSAMGMAAISTAIGGLVWQSAKQETAMMRLELATRNTAGAYEILEKNAKALNKTSAENITSIRNTTAEMWRMTEQLGLGAHETANLVNLSEALSTIWGDPFTQVAHSVAMGLMGMTRALRDYGLDVSDAKVQQWMLEEGIKGTITTMNEAQAVTIRYQYIMANLGNSIELAHEAGLTFTNVFSDMKDSMFEFLGRVGEPFLDQLKSIVMSLSAFFELAAENEAILTFSRNLITITAVLTGLGVAIGLVGKLGTTTFALLGTTATLMTSPIFLTVAAVGLLAAKWDDLVELVKPGVDLVLNFVSKIVDWTWETAKAIYEWIEDKLNLTVEWVIDFSLNIASGAYELARQVWDWLAGVSNVAYEWLASFSFVASAIDAAKATWEWITGTKDIERRFTITGSMELDPGTVWEDFKRALAEEDMSHEIAAVVIIAVAPLKWIWGNVQGAFETVRDAIGEDIAASWEAMKTAYQERDWGDLTVNLGRIIVDIAWGGFKFLGEFVTSLVEPIRKKAEAELFTDEINVGWLDIIAAGTAQIVKWIWSGVVWSVTEIPALAKEIIDLARDKLFPETITVEEEETGLVRTGFWHVTAEGLLNVVKWTWGVVSWAAQGIGELIVEAGAKVRDFFLLRGGTIDTTDIETSVPAQVTADIDVRQFSWRDVLITALGAIQSAGAFVKEKIEAGGTAIANAIGFNDPLHVNITIKAIQATASVLAWTWFGPVAGLLTLAGGELGKFIYEAVNGKLTADIEKVEIEEIIAEAVPKRNAWNWRTDPTYVLEAERTLEDLIYHDVQNVTLTLGPIAPDTYAQATPSFDWTIPPTIRQDAEESLRPDLLTWLKGLTVDLGDGLVIAVTGALEGITWVIDVMAAAATAGTDIAQMLIDGMQQAAEDPRLEGLRQAWETLGASLGDALLAGLRLGFKIYDTLRTAVESAITNLTGSDIIGMTTSYPITFYGALHLTGVDVMPLFSTAMIVSALRGHGVASSVATIAGIALLIPAAIQITEALLEGGADQFNATLKTLLAGATGLIAGMTFGPVAGVWGFTVGLYLIPDLIPGGAEDIADALTIAAAKQGQITPLEAAIELGIARPTMTLLPTAAQLEKELEERWEELTFTAQFSAMGILAGKAFMDGFIKVITFPFRSIADFIDEFRKAAEKNNNELNETAKGLNEINEQLDFKPLEDAATYFERLSESATATNTELKNMNKELEKMLETMQKMGTIPAGEEFYEGGYGGGAGGMPLAFTAFDSILKIGTGRQQGGMTANVGKTQVAGVVHGGEWVAPAWMVDDKHYGRIIAALERIRKGYQIGGLVGYQAGGVVDPYAQLESMLDFMEPIYNLLDITLGNIMSVVLEVAKGIMTAIAKMLETFGIESEAVDAIMDAVTQFDTMLTDLRTSGLEMFDETRKQVQAAREDVGEIKDIIEDVYKPGPLENMLGTIGEALQSDEIINHLFNIANNTETLKNLWQQARETLKVTRVDEEGKIHYEMPNLAEFGGLLDNLVLQGGNLLGEVGALASALGAGTIAVLAVVAAFAGLTAIALKLGDAWNQVKAGFSAATSGVHEMLQRPFYLLGHYIGRDFLPLLRAFYPVIQGLADIGLALWNAFKWLLDPIIAITQMFGHFFKLLSTGVTVMLKFWEIVFSILNPFRHLSVVINWLGDAITWLVDGIVEMVNWVIEQINRLRPWNQIEPIGYNRPGSAEEEGVPGTTLGWNQPIVNNWNVKFEGNMVLDPDDEALHVMWENFLQYCRDRGIKVIL